MSTLVARDDVRILHHVDFYDYPRSGVALWRERRYWFAEGGRDGLMRLYDLTDAEWKHEDERHAAFREHVGIHTDHGPDGRRTIGGVRPGGYEAWRGYYDDPRWKVERDYTNRPPVAEFDLFGEAGSVPETGEPR